MNNGGESQAYVKYFKYSEKACTYGKHLMYIRNVRKKESKERLETRCQSRCKYLARRDTRNPENIGNLGNTCAIYRVE